MQGTGKLNRTMVLELMIQNCIKRKGYSELKKIVESIGESEDDRIIILNVCIAIITKRIDGSEKIKRDEVKGLVVSVFNRDYSINLTPNLIMR